MRRFTHKNEAFLCVNCGGTVLPSSKGCRNHCPHCLYSIHLDVFPGDRAADCRGIMKPVRIEYHTKKGYQVVHKCTKCGQLSKNILQNDAVVQSDNQEIVLRLMVHPEA